MTETEAWDGHDGRTFPREDVDQPGDVGGGYQPGAPGGTDEVGGYQPGGAGDIGDMGGGYGPGVGGLGGGPSGVVGGAGHAGAAGGAGGVAGAGVMAGVGGEHSGVVGGDGVGSVLGAGEDQALERVAARLDQVEARPVAEHVGVFEEILTDLEQALGSVDE
ncbi:hypothetical protein J5X84_21230 [Streptosporangiaceae bacterium NEAU-GS5]|nr:hypothetical protein [Streptosporangiaceae bacterium NEAU-GS5]